MASDRCPRCSVQNSFPSDALDHKVRCKNPSCRHVWRLEFNLPAVSSPSPAVPAAYQTESITRAVVPGVITHAPPAPPLPMPEEITQVEFYCARHDEPLSALYTRHKGDTLFRFQRSEKGTHAIDRWCGTDSGRQHFQRNGGAVQYDRTIQSVDPGNLSGFTCPWCGSKDWFRCGDCGFLICKGSSYTRFGTEYGVCRRTCPTYNPKGDKLGPAHFSISVRKANLSWGNNPSNDPPALPPSNRPRLGWRS